MDRMLLCMLMLLAAYKGYQYGTTYRQAREQTEAQMKHSLELDIAWHSDHDVFGFLQSYMVSTPPVDRYCVTLHNTWLPYTVQVQPKWSLSQWLFEDNSDSTTFCADKKDAKYLFGIMLFCFILIAVYWLHPGQTGINVSNRNPRKEDSKCLKRKMRRSDLNG